MKNRVDGPVPEKVAVCSQGKISAFPHCGLVQKSYEPLFGFRMFGSGSGFRVHGSGSGFRVHGRFRARAIRIKAPL